MLAFGYIGRAFIVLLLFAGFGVLLISDGIRKKHSRNQRDLLPWGCAITLGIVLIMPLVAYSILLWQAGRF